MVYNPKGLVRRVLLSCVYISLYLYIYTSIHLHVFDTHALRGVHYRPVSIYLYIHIYISTSIYVYTCVSAIYATQARRGGHYGLVSRVYISIYLHLYIYIPVYLYHTGPARRALRSRVHIPIYLYLYIYISLYLYLYLYTCIPRHLHIYTTQALRGVHYGLVSCLASVVSPVAGTFDFFFWFS